MSETQETKACPWCGETILAVAKKCKHCGEYLDSEPAPEVPKAPKASGMGWRLEQTGDWVCIQHNNMDCTTCTGKEARPTTSRRAPYKAGDELTRKDGVITCTRCGGTSFQPRRKTSTKVAFGLASLAGRPKHVECVTCGALYRRPN